MFEKISIADKKPEVKSQNLVPQIRRKTESFQSMNSPVDRILFLQRTIGNQAVARLMKSGALQAKLRIGQPGDIYEQEADRVAEQVMRMPDVSSNKDTGVQRKCPKCLKGLRGLRGKDKKDEILQAKETPGQTPEVIPQIESNINALKGGGQPLPESTRAFYEERFGQDFSQVRVHTDAKAAELARSVNAKAFTIGRDVVFGAGNYPPTTGKGKSLLAHELVHVVQQGNRAALQRQSSAGNPLEQEASCAADTIFTDESGRSLSSVWSIVQRQVGAPVPVAPAAATLAGLKATRVRFKTAGALDPANCATIRPAALGVGIGGTALNAMEMTYQLDGTIPAGTEFDITRTRTKTNWERDAAGTWSRIQHDPAGTSDDIHDEDECLTPTAARHVFVVDTPGNPSRNPRGMGLGGGVTVSATATAQVVKFSFAEWVIARNRPLGIGWTRISDPTFTFWHSITSVGLVGGAWSLVDTPSGQKNEIKLGSISVTGATP